MDAVREAWDFSLENADPCRILDAKLRSTAKGLKSWSAKFVGSIRLQLALAREIILQFDAAQEERDVFGQFFDRSHSLLFDQLGLRSVSLQGLDCCFSEEEVWAVVKEIPDEKAPGPDGFTGLFYKVAWPVIKHDVMQVFNAFWSLDTRSLYLLNDAYLVLLRKKPDAAEIKDFRPISLVHSVCKLITKLLSVRLAPKLNELISSNQSAFIKSRCILDNFQAVQLACKLLHRRKVPAVFLKIDLARAFDSVAWPFLLELLEFLGFSRRWRDWMAALLSTSSTKVLLNGRPGNRICHARGLRQGDPLSPMLFVIVMEALNGLICLADNFGYLSRLRCTTQICRALLYADDLVIFVAPVRDDLLALKCLLDIFAKASGLCTNLAKCFATPLRCSSDEIALVQQVLGCQLGTFPCTYLGVPLNLRKLKRCEEQFIVDKVAVRIPKWKGNLLNLAGRTVLVKSTLLAIPIHMAIASCLSSWAIGAIDKLRRSFLWSGSAVFVPGRCKVAWVRLCRPVQYGGLGISDLHLLGMALRVRWLWLQRTDHSKVWAHLPQGLDKNVRDLFRAGTEVILGDGNLALFWEDNWLDGMALDVLAPNLVPAVPPRFRRRSVREGILNSSWVSDIKGPLNEVAIAEYVEVWERVRNVTLSTGVDDQFRWRWTLNGVYSSASAYQACFLGSTVFLGAKFLWKAKVPPKAKFFAWLAAQDRCWTSERRRRHGLQDSDVCVLCDQEVESINHLLLSCSFSLELWFAVFRRLSWEALMPGLGDSLMDWWSLARKKVTKDHRASLDALILLTWWMLWKERNARIFNRGASSPHAVLDRLLAEASLWSLAGFNALWSLSTLLPAGLVGLGVVNPPGSPIIDVM
ncbi:hypothetical protein U9M48_041118 [Paspalum notatum var. saurae]|uniref:Reverse transcriptase domain-containing protein n=1 Tax=Paspalum notatum var. saurae TaxID=547442 RepID=A0AAQ3XG77_PASNO